MVQPHNCRSLTNYLTSYNYPRCIGFEVSYILQSSPRMSVAQAPITH